MVTNLAYVNIQWVPNLIRSRNAPFFIYIISLLYFLDSPLLTFALY